MIYVVLELGLAFLIPVVGAIGSGLLDPVLIAGFMAGCRALEVDEELEIGHLFAGFQGNLRQLAALGSVYLCGKIAIVVAAMGVGRLFLGPLPEMDLDKFDPQDPVLAAAASQFTVVGLLAAALLVPLLMAYWFAPALILFDKLPALEAMRVSFAACRKNLRPFVLYGVAGLILLVLGSIPLALGLVVVVPVLFGTSIYAGYRDIFVAEGGEKDGAR